MLRIYIIVFLGMSISLTAQKEQPKTENLAQLTFVEKRFNYGIITAGEVIQNVFEFTNTGDAPLVITNAKGACDCTVPEYPTEPIQPGETARFVVRFDSAGKIGPQAKSITITANTEPAQTLVQINGKVEKNTAPAAYEVIDELEDVKADALKLYPNPVHLNLNVDLRTYAGRRANIEIINVSNNMAYREKGVDLSYIQEINVIDFEPGIYVISINVEGMHRILRQFRKE